MNVKSLQQRIGDQLHRYHFKESVISTAVLANMRRYACLSRLKTEGLPENIAFLIRRHFDCTISPDQVSIPIIESRDGICFPPNIPIRLWIVVHHTAPCQCGQ